MGPNSTVDADFHFYEKIYERNQHSLTSHSTKTHIPKIIHFIWVGPNPFPEASKKNVKSWQEAHPDWKLIFWTDRERPSPIPEMEQRLLQDFSFAFLKDQFQQSNNFGEQSDLWRFEILYQIGGLYVDHDVICYQSLAPLHAHFDFYVPLEKPHKVKGLKTTILPAICVLGSRSNHPILHDAMRRIQQNWDEIGQKYSDRPNIKVPCRTFNQFAKAVRVGLSASDMVLPAASFFSAEILSPEAIHEIKHHLYGHHAWACTWHTKESVKTPSLSKARKGVKHFSRQISSQINFLWWVNIFLSALNALLIFRLVRKKS